MYVNAGAFCINLPEDQLAAVCEPFVRLDASRSRDTGGLGLAIARTALQAQGGGAPAG